MEDKILGLCKRVVDGEVDPIEINGIDCMGISCKECPFSTYSNEKGFACGSDTKEYYIEKAKEYIAEHTKEEKKEKTFREVIATIKEGEVWESCFKTIECTGCSIDIKKRNGDKFSDSSIGFNNEITYTLKKRKRCTFEEAFKAYEEGKEIESLVSCYRYKKENGKDSFYSFIGNCWHKENKFDIDEIRGEWYIND